MALYRNTQPERQWKKVLRDPFGNWSDHYEAAKYNFANNCAPKYNLGTRKSVNGNVIALPDRP